MPRVRAGGIEMFYVEEGAGEPLVLIMGFGGDHLAWRLQTPVFATRYRVLAFDNRGAGQTDQPDAPYTIPGMAADTVGLMDALGIGRAHVLGVSMGGMIAQELALGFPARVASVQLHCTLARPDRYVRALLDVWRTVRTTLDFADALRAIELWLFAPATFNERPEFVEAVHETALANPHPQSRTGFLRQAEAIAAHDTLDRLAAIRCPTLVTAGEEDILVPVRFAREIAERIPGAAFRLVPGVGHAYFWERPEAFNDLCLGFLATHR
jgi:pimeloyl-ACP methyl ester carboxylesterase